MRYEYKVVIEHYKIEDDVEVPIEKIEYTHITADIAAYKAVEQIKDGWKIFKRSKTYDRWLWSDDNYEKYENHWVRVWYTRIGDDISLTTNMDGEMFFAAWQEIAEQRLLITRSDYPDNTKDINVNKTEYL